jgi:HCOMODA/2-hydroxy-3-carboxy-muconic semialdehyde decarboxylase
MNSLRTDPPAADVVRACRVAMNERLTEAFGHISIRRKSKILITPRKSLAEVETTEQLVELPISTSDLDLPPTAPPEAHLHLGIYRARPDVQAIVRFHSPYALAVSTVVDSLRPTIGYGAYVGVVPIHPDARLVRDQNAGNRVAAALGAANAVLLRGNGAVTVGTSVAEATVRAVWLERAAQAICIVGVGAGQPLSAAELAYYADLPDAGTAQINRAWSFHTNLTEG